MRKCFMMTLLLLVVLTPLLQSPPPTYATATAHLNLVDALGTYSGGVYLGAGLILTGANNVTGERYLWGGEKAPELRYQLHNYLDDGIERPWEKPLNWQLCPDAKGRYQIGGEGLGKACIPYNLTIGMSVHQLVEGKLSEASVPVQKLLYLNRETGIALLQVDTFAMQETLPNLRPVRLDARIPHEIPQWQTQPEHSPIDSSSQRTRVLPYDYPFPVPLMGPFRYWGIPYFSDKGLIGFAWSFDYMTPTSVWANDLWQVSETLQLKSLQAVLQWAIWDESVSGLPSIGDPFTPELGNTGYDVLHYDLTMHLNPYNPYIRGKAVLTIKTTWHHLRRFSLDLRQVEARKILVNDTEVTFTRQANKLWIRLPEPLDYGTEFKLTVFYNGSLKALESQYGELFTVGLEYNARRPALAFANQPDGANTWFPCNDHPSDRATFDFHIAVPQGFSAVANGVPIETSGNVFHWQATAPMSTSLAIVAVGDYALIEDTTTSGIPLRHYAYRGTEDEVATLLSTTDLAFQYFEEAFGAYPYTSYGHVITPLEDAAIETQTMTMLPESITQARNEEQVFTLVAHELAHQWYGNSVTLQSWSDIWLNEGFATYAEWFVLERRYPDTEEERDQRNVGERLLRNSRRTTPLIDPLPDELFSVESYQKGGWVLEMLQNRVGDEAFFAILQTWAAEYRDHPVDSLEFFQLAELVSGQDLSQFRQQWLENTTIPRHEFIWQTSNGNLQILACNPDKQFFSLKIPVVVQGETPLDTTRIEVDLAIDIPQTFAVEFMPDELDIDPDQLFVEDITTLMVDGELGCLAALVQ